MHYKFRWYYAVICFSILFMMGLVVDLLPRWQELQSARQEEKQLANQLSLLSQIRNKAEWVSVGKIYFAPIIMKLADQQKITISKVTELSEQRLRFTGSGDYTHLSFFIASLLEQASFTTFSFQAVTNSEAAFTAEAMPLSIQHPFVFIPHNPFCWQTTGSENGLNINGQQIDIQNANLSDTLLALAKLLHRNVVISPNVMGKVTLHLQQTQPAKVFELLLDTNGLGKWVEGELWYVAPRDELIKRKQQEVKWQNLSYQAEELIMESWQIRYSKAADIGRLLKDDKTSLLSSRGQVRVDERTNLICVQDVAARMMLIKRLIMKLDRPTPQVHIEARLASVDHDFERELGVDFSVKTNGAQDAVPGRYSVAIAHLPDGSLLDVKLAALENAGHANLISSPSLYTANQQTAAIEAGEEVPYQEVSESGGTAVVFKKAVLGLKVTPQILPNGYVLLQLHISQDRPGSRMVLGMPTISTRQIVTSVLVKGGQTAVLGGIYENQDENAVQRIPLVGSIPVVGELFTLRASRRAKRELLIFVTPKIMTQLP